MKSYPANKLPKRRRSLSPVQRRMLERGLCCCADCVRQRPERAALLAVRDAEAKGRASRSVGRAGETGGAA